MKANELRIGNLVYLRSKEKIYHISSGHDIEEIDDATEVFDATPILLTEEWLKKLGFSLMTDTTPYNYRIHKNKSFCYIRYGTFGTFENGIEKSFQGFNGLFIANKFVRVIKYVHELQNLYFGLTGEELNLHVGIQGNEAKS